MFYGLAGSGKDTCAEYLISKYGGMVVKFAEPIYDISNYIQDRLGLPRYKDRKLLQYIGHEYGRESIDPNIWVNLAKKKINELENTNTNIFITDNRYQNEIDALPDFVKIKLIRYVDKMDHPSENQQIPNDKFDFIIENNDDLESLYLKLDYVVGQF